MFKILIADKLAQEGIDLINSIDDFEAVVRTGLSEDELVEIIGDYDGLIIRSATTVTPKILANSGKLKGIARAGVGVDNIDIPAATQKGILVMNTPG
ncbi:MAG: phosphoglycerate dehydrogenase, partial [Planctomycetota bacterium]